MSKIKEVNLEEIILNNIDLHCLITFDEFSKEVFENSKIVELLVTNNLTPVLKDLKKIYPAYVELVQKSTLLSLKKSGKYKEICVYLFKFFEKKHKTILGTQIDGDYHIIGIADENNFLCSFKSDIPQGNNDQYHIIHNLIVSMDNFDLNNIVNLNDKNNTFISQWRDEFSLIDWEEEINNLIDEHSESCIFDYLNYNNKRSKQ